ncbi:MAG: extracellular solute-binding protein [Acidibrevibacterium sp.]|jgi:multiple sugar transport system substrate-binding protein|uniref:ABC transporter substrate-binding protein n=1 Tax=Acidibrevibacterium fodinaquatile TaxID=1969806 RepID=UPI0023A7ECFD|nr:extracellular solute-binding protein [Acidibrevibacterium fodinaquatile]MCA7120394.1 extracellular solute-binding protein [Acidibrevibacterium fodinaquatile]
MHEKAQDLARAFVAGRIGRRDLIRRLAALGVAFGTAESLLNATATGALAADFDWKKHKGTQLRLLLNKHPYADAMIADLANFKALTGMEVTYDIFPEDVYFDKVTAALSSRSTQYDVFMTGAYQTWQYGPAGWLVDFNEYLKDPAKTAATYDWDDILPNLRASTAWSGKPGAELGGPGAHQWAIPWGFELNNLSYNQTVFDKLKLNPPRNMEELMASAAKITKDAGGPYGIGVRGSRSWATIHPGFLSAYTNYGQRDFTMTGGKLKAAMNTPESKAFHKLWVQMIQDSGPKNWATYTWYQVGTDLGAGASGMIYDADILGYFMNGGDNRERGHLAYAPFAANPAASGPTSNVWIWSLAMSNFSKQKDAGWTFIQWASGTDHLLFGARKNDVVNPVRNSVWRDADFKERIAKSYPGYLNQYEKTAPDAKIYFTPQPLFFNLTTEWAASLQRMVAREVSVDEGLDKLAESVNRQLHQAGIG